MSLEDKLQQLQSDFSNLDADNIGNWPIVVKAVCWALAMAVVIGGGYYFVLKEEGSRLDGEVANEQKLKGEFEQKVQDAANLEAYRAQIAEMNSSFETLLNQLPKDTEVPGLIDDITVKGTSSGLSFDQTDLQPEKRSDYYVELPISIKVQGGFHDFGTFISGVAGMPRIVTLHDFIIQAAKGDGGKGRAATSATGANTDQLAMTILAKTYRYKTQEEMESEKKVAAPAKGKATAKKAAPKAAK